MTSQDEYTQRPPPAALRHVVAASWQQVTGTAGRRYRVVPDGCADLIWTGRRLFVAGPDTGPVLADIAPGRLVAVRFRPGVAPAVLGLPANELTDQRPDAADLPMPGARRLADTLAASADPARELERAVAQALRPDRLDPVLAPMVAGLRSGRPIAEVADRLGLTERGLHRRAVAAFGYRPKLLYRILRFQRAVGLARTGLDFASVAADIGYADQAHLARDVRELAGVPLGVLIGTELG